MRKDWMYFGLIILWVLCLTVVDSRADVVVSQDQVHATVTDYVHDMLTDFTGEVDVTVRRYGDLRVEGPGAVRLRVRPDRRRSHARSFPLVLEVVRGPVVVREYRVIAEVRYFDDVVVALQPIDRGDPIDEGAVTVERREVTMLLGKYFSGLEALSDMRAKMRIGMGRPLSSHYLERIPLVERGDMVRIEAKVGGIVATTVGVAKDDGAHGERIVVQNSNSREKLLAEVIAPGKVRVIF